LGLVESLKSQDLAMACLWRNFFAGSACSVEGEKGGKPQYKVFYPRKPFLPLRVWVKLLEKLFEGGSSLQNKAFER
jgi:hypothetical protein